MPFLYTSEDFFVVMERFIDALCGRGFIVVLCHRDAWKCHESTRLPTRMFSSKRPPIEQFASSDSLSA